MTQELDSLFGHIFNAVGHINRRFAYLGRASDGAITTGLADGYVWVRPQEGGETRAKNVGAVSTRVPNTPIEIGENTRTGELEVLRVAPEAIEILGSALTGRASTPDTPPEFATSVIPADLLQDLRLRQPDTDHAGMNVALEAGRTEFGYRYKAHADVSAYTPPTAGMRWWVLGYLDEDNALQFSTSGSSETGMAATEMIKTPAALDTLIDALPDGSYPIGAFVLDNGQTAVTGATTQFLDARLHYARKGIEPLGWRLTHDTTLTAGHDYTLVGTIRTGVYALTINGYLSIL